MELRENQSYTFSPFGSNLQGIDLRGQKKTIQTQLLVFIFCLSKRRQVKRY